MNPDKVYIITEGEFSDYHIVKACSTKERAEQAIDDIIQEDHNTHSDKEYSKQYRERFYIEEYELLE